MTLVGTMIKCQIELFGPSEPIIKLLGNIHFLTFFIGIIIPGIIAMIFLSYSYIQAGG